VVQAVYADPATAPVSAEVKTALALIETFTLHPEDLGPEDIAAARSAGLTDEAIEHAFDVATMFNLIDRLADAFDFFVAEEQWFDQGAKMLLRMGYKFPPFLYPRP
jgi:alkylhydroperoxidase family enzyme